ncbi:hypothetical protein QBC35DRAFT_540908 [Podospora australis]|uniref:Uncharacterized protein n=1 Tax=Podospora australis TaxID=1536484 RepID=A0AAN6WLP0_9PEZI|nr:hypothetical protein QBC35DRAFT_540908 [Podospora australis]
MAAAHSVSPADSARLEYLEFRRQQRVRRYLETGNGFEAYPSDHYLRDAFAVMVDPILVDHNQQATRFHHIFAFLEPNQIRQSIATRSVKETEPPHLHRALTECFDRACQALFLNPGINCGTDFPTNYPVDVRLEWLASCSVQQKQEALETAVCFLAYLWPAGTGSSGTNPYGPEDFLSAGELFPYVEHIRTILERLGTGGDFVPPRSTHVVSLFNRTSWYLTQRGDDARCYEYAELAMKIYPLPAPNVTSADRHLSFLLAQSRHVLALAGATINRPVPDEVLGDMKALATQHQNKVQLADAHIAEGMLIMRNPTTTRQQQERVCDSWAAVCLKELPDGSYNVEDYHQTRLASAINLTHWYASCGDTEIQNARSWRSIARKEWMHVKQMQSLVAFARFDDAVQELEMLVGTQQHPMLADIYYDHGAAMYKDTGGNMREESCPHAILLLRESVEIYDAITPRCVWLQPQHARSLFMLGLMLRTFTNNGKQTEGDMFIARAMDLRRQYLPSDTRTSVQLTYTDFENAVYFSSK